MTIRDTLRTLRRSLVPDAGWGALKRIRRLELVAGPLTYNQDGLASIHNCDFRAEPQFAEAYALGRATGSWGSADVHWRAHVACWAAQKGMSLEGDFVECGVHRGGLARTIIAYTGLDRSDRKFYLLDTFRGLVGQYITDEERALGVRAGGYQECYESVQQTFAPFHNVILVRGAVPETLSEVRSTMVAFLSLDMNCAPPEIAAAEHFWDRLATGAVMLLDDYGWPGHIVQKRSFDRFAHERDVSVLALPTGQGIIIKP